jgi:hypothetical protein
LLIAVVLPKWMTGIEEPEGEGDEGDNDEKKGKSILQALPGSQHQRVLVVPNGIPFVPEKTVPITTTSVATGVERR